MNYCWNTLGMPLMWQKTYLSMQMRSLQFTTPFGYIYIGMSFGVGNRSHSWFVCKKWVCKGKLIMCWTINV
jgi:hypothetical protein